MCYKKALKNNKELVDKESIVFFNVQAEFSSENGVYAIKDNKVVDDSNELWEKTISYLNENDLNTILKMKVSNFDKYEIDI